MLGEYHDQVSAGLVDEPSHPVKNVLPRRSQSDFQPLAALRVIGLCRATSSQDESIVNESISDPSLPDEGIPIGLEGEEWRAIPEAFEQAGATEVVVLATCYRLEVYWLGLSESIAAETLAKIFRRGPEEPIPPFFIHRGEAAARHLFGVVSGVESPIFGETEIVKQVRDAVGAPSLPGPNLHLLFNRALKASKRVRSETELSRGILSLASLAVNEARRFYGSLANRTVLVVGAGFLGHRLVKELAAEATGRVVVINRTEARARAIADKFGLEAAPFDRLKAVAREADVIFTAVSGTEPVVKNSMFEGTKIPLLVDLGLPPNAEKTAGPAIDMETIARQCNENAENRRKALPAACAILDEEAESLAVEFLGREASIALRAVSAYGDQVRQVSLRWAKDQLPTADEKTNRVMETLAQRMAVGLLDGLVRKLKKGAVIPADQAALVRVFSGLREGMSD